MEIALVLIVILALIGGSAALISRQRRLPWTIPIPRLSGGGPDAVAPADDAIEAAVGPIREPILTVSTQSPPGTKGAISGLSLEPIRLDLAPPTGDLASARLDRIEARLDELQLAVGRQSDRVAEEARRIHADLALRAEAEEARRDAVQERLRADILAMVSRAITDRKPGTGARRMEVSAELYAQLARLESALATVTNPVLLPGEPYSPPSELLAETFIWENWNDVGERTFALAEIYSAQRLHLSAQTRADVGAFVTNLRTLLTRSVYPNVQREADKEQHAALRAALAEIALEMPKIRDLLETEYLEGRSD